MNYMIFLLIKKYLQYFSHRKLDEQLVKSLQKKSKKVLIPPIHINMSIKAALQQEELLQVHSTYLYYITKQNYYYFFFL